MESLLSAPPNADQFYESVHGDVPELAEKGKDRIMAAADLLIKNGSGKLELAATGVNVLEWIKAQPPIYPEAKQGRFIKGMERIVEDGGWVKKGEPQIIEDLMENLLSEKNSSSPMQIKEYLAKMRAKPTPSTVWQVICNYNAIFI